MISCEPNPRNQPQRRPNTKPTTQAPQPLESYISNYSTILSAKNPVYHISQWKKTTIPTLHTKKNPDRVRQSQTPHGPQGEKGPGIIPPTLCPYSKPTSLGGRRPQREQNINAWEDPVLPDQVIHPGYSSYLCCYICAAGGARRSASEARKLQHLCFSFSVGLRITPPATTINLGRLVSIRRSKHTKIAGFRAIVFPQTP